MNFSFPLINTKNFLTDPFDGTLICTTNLANSGSGSNATEEVLLISQSS